MARPVDQATIDYLLLHRSEPDARAVLGDLRMTLGYDGVPLPRPVQAQGDGDGGGGDGDGGYGCGGGGDGGDGDGGDGGYGSDGGDGSGYGGYGGGGYGGDGGDGGYGDGYGGYGGGGYGGDGGDGGYGDGYGGYGGYGDLTHYKKKGLDMHPGLRIISVPCGYNPYILVGWLRRKEGDEYELVGARVIRRFGQSRAITELAALGPAADTQLLPASIEPAEFNRMHIVRSEIGNEKAWAKECPRPEGWTDIA